MNKQKYDLFTELHTQQQTSQNGHFTWDFLIIDTELKLQIAIN